MADGRVGDWVRIVTRLRAEYDRLSYIRRFLLVRDSAYHRILAADGIRRVSMALSEIAENLEIFVAKWCDLTEKGGDIHGGVCESGSRDGSHQQGASGMDTGDGGAQARADSYDARGGGCSSEKHIHC